jgi:hypothetical protein
MPMQCRYSNRTFITFVKSDLSHEKEHFIKLFNIFQRFFDTLHVNDYFMRLYSLSLCCRVEFMMQSDVVSLLLTYCTKWETNLQRNHVEPLEFIWSTPCYLAPVETGRRVMTHIHGNQNTVVLVARSGSPESCQGNWNGQKPTRWPHEGLSHLPASLSRRSVPREDWRGWWNQESTDGIRLSWFLMILTINSDYFPKQLNQLIVAMVKCCVLFEARNYVLIRYKVMYEHKCFNLTLPEGRAGTAWEPS